MDYYFHCHWPGVRRQEVFYCRHITNWLERWRDAWWRFSTQLKCTTAICHTQTATDISTLHTLHVYYHLYLLLNTHSNIGRYCFNGNFARKPGLPSCPLILKSLVMLTVGMFIYTAPIRQSFQRRYQPKIWLLSLFANVHRVFQASLHLSLAAMIISQDTSLHYVYLLLTAANYTFSV